MGGRVNTKKWIKNKHGPVVPEHHHPKSNIAKAKKAIKRGPTLKPIRIGANGNGENDEDQAKNGASVFRTYIHIAAPEFRDEAVRQVKSLLLASAPRLKYPKVMTKGNQGLLIDATLRDIYVLSHGLRCADDIMVQVGRPQHKVGSFNRFIKHLAKLPLHAFAPRIMPKETPHRVGRQTKAKDTEDDSVKKMAEMPLLHNNIRILTNRSILSNQKILKQFSQETVKKLLTLRRGQSLKKRNIRYTDNPALFGKAENEIDDTLLQLAEDKAARHLKRIEMRQIQLIASKQKNETHLKNLFYTNLRLGENDEKNNEKNNENLEENEKNQKFSEKFNDDNDDMGIPMNVSSSSRSPKYGARNGKGSGLQRPNGRSGSPPGSVGEFVTNKRISTSNSEKMHKAIDGSNLENDDIQDLLNEFDDEELHTYINDRIKYFKRHGIEYNPREDPIVQDFIAQNEEHNNFHDENHENDDKHNNNGDNTDNDDDYSDLDDVSAPDGTSINYNDFVGPDGQLDTDAFNKALQGMLQTQGFSVDDLEETSLKEVTGKVGDHVKKVHKKMKNDDENDEVSDDVDDQNHDENNQQKKKSVQISLTDENDESSSIPALPVDYDAEDIDYEAVLNRHSEGEKLRIKEYQNKLNF